MLNKSAKVRAAAKQETAPAATGLPLFFSKPAALDSDRHAKAGLKKNQNFAFAQPANSIPLNIAEFIEAAKSYPIVFTTDEEPLPAAVVGLEKDNYFVSGNGEWRTYNYIPAYVRKYPFVFTEVPDRKQFVLCIDEAAPHFAAKAGSGDEPLYTKDSKPSAMVTRALEFCSAFHNHYVATRRFCADLKEAGLLVPHQSDVTLNNGRKIRLAGFQLIDAEKFEKLPEKTFLEFRSKGWLPFIYQALQANTNWKLLVDLAAASEKKK